MKLARFSWKDQVNWGVLVGDTLHALDGELWGDMKPGAALCALEDVRLLAPIEPHNKVIGCGLTFKAMWEKMGSGEKRDGPAIFMKQPTTRIGPLEPILYPEICTKVGYEAELGVVIGRRARLVSGDKALDYVGGYTCVNDVTAMEMKTVERPIVSTRFKEFDTFCPLGPVIETDLDPSDVTVICRLNGKEVSIGHTSEIEWSIGELIAWVSTIMTLMPGDIIATGAPGLAPVQVGDMVEVDIAEIGVLRNPVAAPR